MRCDAVTRACCIFDAEKQRLHLFYTGSCEKAAPAGRAQSSPAALYAAQHGPAAGRTANEQKRQDRPHGTGRTDQKRSPKMTDAILQQLAAAYGTPTFVFDVGCPAGACARYTEVFGPDIKLCYSIKANPFLLPAMSAVTARLEVCSPGELSVCEPAGSGCACHLFRRQQNTCRHCPCRRRRCRKLHRRIPLQVRYLQEAARAAGRRLPVLLRLNAGSQFGMSKQDLFSALKNAQKHRILTLSAFTIFRAPSARS